MMIWTGETPICEQAVNKLRIACRGLRKLKQIDPLLD